VSEPRLLIIGKIPPPIGGVTIHVQRLLNSLSNNFIDYCFYDYRKESYINGLKKIFIAEIVHLHFSNKNVRLFFVLLLKCLHKRIIITFHGKYAFDDFRDYLSLYISSCSFVLNHYTYKNAVKKIINKQKVQLISAFIPPGQDEDSLDEIIIKKINEISVHRKYILCTNANNFVIDEQGKDLYGIDFLLNIIRNRLDLCLIISDPSGKLKEHYPVQYNNILFISEPHSFCEIIKISDMYIRATTTDGDSLSVKEGLFYRKKVIASDCVDRPFGCFLYKTGDQQSFEAALAQPWEESDIDVQDGAEQILKTYNIC
jgi:glycosyltransferase involved in cell wall biosynthesis